jgi:hypothetical protein
MLQPMPFAQLSLTVPPLQDLREQPPLERLRLPPEARLSGVTA